jgi:hypothetical protein
MASGLAISTNRRELIGRTLSLKLVPTAWTSFCFGVDSNTKVLRSEREFLKRFEGQAKRRKLADSTERLPVEIWQEVLSYLEWFQVWALRAVDQRVSIPCMNSWSGLTPARSCTASV